MSHPFVWLSGNGLRWLVLALLLAAAGTVMLARLGPLDEVLKSRVPAGIFGFEFSATAANAGRMLEAWRGLEEVIRVQTYWDFLFLLCYPPALSLACAMLVDAPANPVPMVGAFVAWAVLAASPLDAIENLAMLRMVAAGPGEALARLATGCAGLKFTVLLAAVGYLITVGAATLLRRLA